MPKSKNRKNHAQKVANYKTNKKKAMEALKKKMIEEYIRAQQQQLAEQKSHTSTEEVATPEIEVGTEQDGTSIPDAGVDLAPEIDIDVNPNLDDTIITGQSS